MPLPAGVLAAKERMERADVALRDDIESDQQTIREAHPMIDDLQLAADEYVEKISRRA